MKVHIEVTDGLTESEVVIRCAQVDEHIRQLCRLLREQDGTAPKIVFYKENREYYFPPEDVLFFETEGEHVYAHTENDAFRTHLRLYELENLLPRAFVRMAKSTIVNTEKIYSVTRNITSASLIQFSGTHKQIYASRYYVGELRQRLQERGSLHHET